MMLQRMLLLAGCALAGTAAAATADQWRVPVAVEKLGEGSLMRAVLHGDKERGSFMAGQCACMCDRVQPAAEIVRELFDPAAIKTALGRARTSLEADA